MIKPFSSNRVLQALFCWIIVVWIVTAIKPLYPRDWLLENLLVFFSVGILLITYRWFQFSNTSYALFSLFLTLHLFGAHYTYSRTPFGFWLQDWLGWERNHYDRIVHFSFGLLLAYPLEEVLLRLSGAKRSWSYVLAVALVAALSAIYEVIEGAAAMIVDPDLGTAFLGTQGDQWDTQKDAFLAFSGAVVAMLACWVWMKTTHTGRLSSTRSPID